MRQSGASSCISNGASGRNKEVEERRIENMLATTDKQAIPRAFGMTTKPRREPNVTNHGFPYQRYKSRKPRPTATKSATP